MRAVVLKEYGEPLAVEDVESPEPAPHGVVIETEACGICRSDWHAWQGHGEWAGDKVPRGQVLGHEPAGRVVAAGERVETLEEGDRIAVPFCLGDGTCRYCRNGHGNVCPNGRALGFDPAAPGAFAERVHVPHAAYNAVRLPAGVEPAEVAALGCRYMTAYHGLTHRGDVDPTDWVAVHGCGGVGLSAVQLASAVGAGVIAVDIDGEKLELARELGAAETVNAAETERVPKAIKVITDGGADVSVDALGIAETCRNSVECLRRRGRHVQLGLTTDEEEGEVALPIDKLALAELTVAGSRGMPPSRIDELVGLVDRGTVDPGRLVTRRVDLEDVPGRLAAMTDYGTVGIEVVTGF